MIDCYLLSYAERKKSNSANNVKRGEITRVKNLKVREATRSFLTFVLCGATYCSLV